MERFIWRIGLAAVLALCLVSGEAHAFPVSGTGQDACYDASGSVLDPYPAPGEAFYGQDAQYPGPVSFTKMDANGVLSKTASYWTMVRDDVTGLVWEVKHAKDGTKDYSNPNDADNIYTWYDTNSATNGGNQGTEGNGTDTQDFIQGLNAIGYGGRTDWRLPTVKELSSLFIEKDSAPLADLDFFPSIMSSNYWTSTPNKHDATCAWECDFSTGTAFHWDIFKANSYFVRAVASGSDESDEHLVDNGDGTVTDLLTGLMWQKNFDAAASWESALAYCESLSLAEFTDWRLPNKKDLQTIADYGEYDPAINEDIFPGVFSEGYWTSTTVAAAPSQAWRINFVSGTALTEEKTHQEYYVRAVRGGQGGSLGSGVIVAPAQASGWDAGDVLPIAWNAQGLGANVRISLSRQGGKTGTFETIIGSTANDGAYDWTVTGAGSVNCVLKIEQADNAANWAALGLFSIKAIGDDIAVNLADANTALKIVSGNSPGGTIDLNADVNSDNQIGLEEAINALQKAAGKR